MRGLMQDQQLLVTRLLDFAADFHAEQQVVSQQTEGPIQVYTYSECRRRSQACCLALKRLGVRLGDRVATMAWNNARHLESWYAIMGMGAVCHTLNPRLFPQDLEYIINHAEDAYILFDLTFLKLIEALRPRLKTVKGFIILTDATHMPPNSPQGEWICYEDLLAPEFSNLKGFRWDEFDENTACGLCYTSGTTGKPKGVLYSHRSNFLQAFVVNSVDALNYSAASRVLPIVPMFHANSWGIVFAGPMVGAALILPGPKLDGESIYKLITKFEVDSTAGVPTVCAGLLQYCDEHKLRLSTLRSICVGGAACPLAMIRAFEEKHGITVRHLWGMTETSPIGTVGALKPEVAKLPLEERQKISGKQGRPHILVQMRVIDDLGKPLPWDGKSAGHLQVRGPHVLKEYYKVNLNATSGRYQSTASKQKLLNQDRQDSLKHDGKHNVDADGWFDTGDVATLDRLGHMQITDRSKDVIKSGGEWVSSIEIENAAAGCSGVQEAAVIGIPHPEWTERPLLVVVKAPGSNISKEAILKFLQGKVAKWWIPDDVVFLDEIPHTAAGKISKLTLREQLKDYRISKAAL